jgi:RNA polymerase sigma-70 factor (ECF subfamily)
MPYPPDSSPENPLEKRDLSPSDRAKLPPTEGVNKAVGTIALNPEMYPKAVGNGGAGAIRAANPRALAEMTDADVMLLAGTGDDSAFEYLVDKFRRPIVSFMYRMCHNQAVAEELAQEVFLRVYRSRASYQAEAKFTTWLYRIATNLAVNHARDTRSERMAPSVNLDEPDPETGTTPDVADSTPTVEADILRQERLAAIRKHIMALPERQRVAVLMHKYQGLDYKEIGKVLKLSESATKSLLFRAYETLRERLKEFV